MDELLIHLHIPKCAGTSINTVLQDRFPGLILGNRNPETVERLERLSVEERDRAFAVVLGHWEWGIHEKFSRPAVYFSVVRPPISRIASFYNFIHRDPNHGLHRVLKRSLTDLNAFADVLMENPHIRRNWSNYYCYAYSGRHPADEADYVAIETHVLAEMERGRLVVGSVARIAAFLRERGILDGDLPRRNVTDHDRTDGSFVPASFRTLRPETIARFERWNLYDIRLLSAIAEWEADR